MTLDTRHWPLALLTAALLHAVAAIAWMVPSDDQAGEAVSETGIEVMLGDDGSANDDMPTPEAEPEPEPTPVPPKPQPTPKPVPPEPQPTPPQAAAPQPAAATAEPPPEAAPQPAAVSTVAEATEAAAAPAPPPPPKSGGGVAGGATAARKQSYFGELAAHLARHQRYPVEARRRKVSGVVTLHFRFNAKGDVTEFAVTKSAGHRLLDDEAIAMLKRAQPLPPIPEELGADSINISLPIEFSLRRK